MNLEKIIDYNPEAIKADGFDDCIIGITKEGCIVYDINKMIEQMCNQNHMTYEESQEYFDFNIAGSYLGEYTPIYIYT
jgi:hypothetical protein